MPVNFFQLGCQTYSNNQLFGLCDNPDPAKDPAYIDELETTSWIAEVHNPNSIQANFFAVDHCSGVDLRRPNGEIAKRCDGILLHEQNISFVELKDRKSRAWASDGAQQLLETIQFFHQNHDISSYVKINAHVTNRQRPMVVTSFSIIVQRFKNETAIILGNSGILLKLDRKIHI